MVSIDKLFRSKDKDKEESNKKFLEESRATFNRKWETIMKCEASLASYDVVRTLGTGTFGRVLLVKRKPTSNSSSNEEEKVLALKVLDKQHVVKLKQVEHVLNEKKVLCCIDHPFTVKLDAFFKDNSNIYFALEFVGGGEMFRHLRSVGKYKESTSKFYAGQVILALEYLQNCHILYRDLKPENILIDPRGFLRITDFGFAKLVKERTYTLCGTPEYLAPEIILSKAYGRSVDWWACGILIYEMAAGHAPFRAKDPMDLYEKIVEGHFDCPAHFSSDIKDLLKNILQVDITKRYGNLKNGVKDIKDHKWFNSIDWNALFEMKGPAPYIPKVKGAGDASNFEEYEEEQLKVAPAERFAYEFRDF